MLEKVERTGVARKYAKLPMFALNHQVMHEHIKQEHTEACLREFGLWFISYEIYTRYWNKHCRNCRGAGGFYSSYDPSAPGVSLASGSMTDFDTCPTCVDQGICPRCGTKDTIDEDCTRCSACGFTFTFEEAAPPQPECYCWETQHVEG